MMELHKNRKRINATEEDIKMSAKASKGKYMAYVGSYSYTGKAKGITVFDVDVEVGKFHKRCEVEVDNSSYVIQSRDGKTLYSIADEGVVAFRISANGSLTRLNSANIKGMRGCHLSTDQENNYIFVSGYHDGKVTILSLNKDGSIGQIVDGMYHKGLGSIAERNFRPHITCSRKTHDGKYVMCCDSGLDQVRIYRFDDGDKKLMQVDAIYCDLESAPRHFRFSADGRFIYLMYEQKNIIDVYSYEAGVNVPIIEKIQTIETTGKRKSSMTAACSIRFSNDGKHLFCGNAGDETVAIYDCDLETGLLSLICCLPISGEYPKDIAVFPDDDHIAVMNHESGTLTFFKVDYEKGLLVMSSNEVRCNEPNCCAIIKVGR